MTDDQTALIVPALEVEDVVGDLRMRHSPDARAGVPPHITVLFPFLEPEAVTAKVTDELESMLALRPPFDYSLVAAREFEGRVLYLAPEPAAPFVAMTDLISRRFGVRPYAGEFGEPVPHLTVGEDISQDERGRVAAAVEAALPRPLRASEVWLLVGRTERVWTRRNVFLLGGRHTAR